MEVTLYLAAEAPLTLTAIPWSFVMAFASLALIYFLFRRHGELFEDFGFSGREVALLTLGSVAGWAVNVPLALVGGTYLAVNVGGALVPVLLVGWWLRKRKLRPIAALVGTALVTLVTWRIVEFHPEAGIVTRYPYFFLPVVVALAYALAVSVRRPVTGVPVAYASGSMGALIGADLMHVQDIRAHFETAPENTVISIGGAGVFDMVFLAGTFAMALHLAVIIGLGARGAKRIAAGPTYPAAPVSLRDSRHVWESYRRLGSPNALERALAAVALSNLALREGDYARSVRMSWVAVDSLMRAEAVRRRPPGALPRALDDDVARLGARYRAARDGRADLKQAGEANATAKHVLAALVPLAALRHQLEGVA